MDDGETEHAQAQNRKDDSGDDETFPCAWVCWEAFIDACGGSLTHRPTTACYADLPHIACEFYHPTQFMGKGEFNRGRSGVGHGTFPLETVGRVVVEERDMRGCEQEYSI